MSLVPETDRRIEVIFCRIDPSLYSQREISRMAYDLLRTHVNGILGKSAGLSGRAPGEGADAENKAEDPFALKIGRTEHGKPYFEELSDIHFNISHAGEYILAALGSEPLGIDIEKRRKVNFERLGKRIMTDPEYRDFLESEDREEEFFRKWVLMESYVKWTGLGLAAGMQGLPMNGWGTFLYLDKGYFAALRTEFPAEIVLAEYRRDGDGFRKL